MNDKVEGLVLKISDYKENDLLIDCLTRDHLFFSFVARGSKKLVVIIIFIIFVYMNF